MGVNFTFNDGGRQAAGFKGKTRDCVTRAIAIVTGMDYLAAYTLVNTFSDTERPRRNVSGAYKSSARTGVKTSTQKRIMAHLGLRWVPLMTIGSGCKYHLRADELPKGRIICKVSAHVVAVIDGVVHDTFDSTRDGTRCVYGYWVL